MTWARKSNAADVSLRTKDNKKLEEVILFLLLRAEQHST